MAKVKQGDIVSVHYLGTLADGEVFDTSHGRDPLQFEVGAGQMIAGFDTAVEGMEIGEKKTVTIEAAEAYGERREDLMLPMDRSILPDGMSVEVGQELQLSQQDGQQIPAVVAGLTETEVVFDLNHPLAGEALTFDIELIELQTAEK